MERLAHTLDSLHLQDGQPDVEARSREYVMFSFVPLFVGLAFIQVLAPLREEPWVASCLVVLRILETNMEIDNVPVLSGTMGSCCSHFAGENPVIALYFPELSKYR
jgi:hypothetical protein